MYYNAQNFLSERFNKKSLESVHELAIDIENFLYDTKRVLSAYDIIFNFSTDFELSSKHFTFQIQDNNTAVRQKEIKINKVPDSYNLFLVKFCDAYSKEFTLFNKASYRPTIKTLEQKFHISRLDTFGFFQDIIIECLTDDDQSILNVNNIAALDIDRIPPSNTLSNDRDFV